MNIAPAGMVSGRYYVNDQKISKSNAMARCQSILRTHRPHGSILTREDLFFVGSILLPYRDDTADPLFITVNPALSHNSFCFWYRTKNGGMSAFSYKNAIAAPGSAVRRRVCSAMRFEVKPQIQEWRDRNGISDPTIHADHIIPFSKILDDFCNQRQIEIEDIPVMDIGDQWQIADHKLANDWYQYHLQTARLQALPAFLNVAKSNHY